MENENNLKSMINNSLQEIREIMDANTVTGKPILLPNGVTIIPVSKISVGFASGGLDLPTRVGAGIVKDFGGGGGTGVTVTPVGFLSVSPDGKTELIPVNAVTAPGPLEQISDFLDNAPQLLDRVRNLLNGKSETTGDAEVEETRVGEDFEEPEEGRKAKKKKKEK